MRCRRGLLTFRLPLVPGGLRDGWNVAVGGVRPGLQRPRHQVLRVLRHRQNMIMVNLWFSFFHEARHILDEKKKTSFLTGQAWADSPDEKIADDYAAEMLLPKAHNAEVCALRTRDELDSFAQEHNLAPGIVAGRFHYLTKRFAMFKDAASHFSWNEGEWKVA